MTDCLFRSHVTSSGDGLTLVVVTREDFTSKELCSLTERNVALDPQDLSEWRWVFVLGVGKFEALSAQTRTSRIQRTGYSL